MFAENPGVYGVRKVHAELRRQGHPVARCTVARLMRAAGLRGISRAKGPRTTVPATTTDTRPDLVDRAFAATAPNQLWVADFTYVWTWSGWVYVAFVFDAHSRRILGWRAATSMTARGMRWFHLPIPDVTAPGPAFEEAWRREARAHGRSPRCKLQEERRAPP